MIPDTKIFIIDQGIDTYLSLFLRHWVVWEPNSYLKFHVNASPLNLRRILRQKKFDSLGSELFSEMFYTRTESHQRFVVSKKRRRGRVSVIAKRQALRNRCHPGKQRFVILLLGLPRVRRNHLARLVTGHARPRRMNTRYVVRAALRELAQALSLTKLLML
jgi:hypothetical protein